MGEYILFFFINNKLEVPVSSNLKFWHNAISDLDVSTFFK